MYIAHFLKKEVTGSPSEVCKLERKNFFLENLLPWQVRLKKYIFYVGLIPKQGRFEIVTVDIKACEKHIDIDINAFKNSFDGLTWFT